MTTRARGRYNQTNEFKASANSIIDKLWPLIVSPKSLWRGKV